MPLPSGSRLGPYEILSVIGAGGMGEVYKARDTRLDRVVAIKRVLGSLADADGELRARFQQEARTIAALNHPHICTIHDVGLEDGTDFLVMEHLVGETLADRLGRQTPSLAEALQIAMQIARALDRAHRAGITHRDLKPANVMLVGAHAPTESGARRSGQGDIHVKLLDFGLAKRAAAVASSELSAAATMAAGPSDAGKLVGTLQYMSPEQLEGQDANPRSDIFAFGAVLYEMLTGATAFDGKSRAALTAAILEHQPVPPRERQPLVSEQLQHVVMRCLEKDPERRWQSLADVAGELQWIAAQPASAGAAAAGVHAKSRAQQWTVVSAALLLAAAVLAGAWMLRSRSAARAPKTLRFEVATSPTDEPASLALSPDGSQLAYVAKGERGQQLWVRPLDRLEARALPGSEGASYPFWSPDGRSLGFFAENKLKRIDLAGGVALALADAPNARGGAWSPDGVILYVPGVNAPIFRVPSAGGSPSKVTELGRSAGPAHRAPQFLPDGRSFLFHSALGAPDTNGTYVASLEGRPPVRVKAGGGVARFAAPDRLLLIEQGALVAFAFDPAKRAVSPEPTVVAPGFGSGLGAAAFSTSGNGVLAYRTGGGQQRQLKWVDRAGRALGAIGEPGSDALAGPELSPDGRTLAVFRQPQSSNDIWLIDLARSVPTRLTTSPAASASPLWAADGKKVFFTSRREGANGVFQQEVSGGDATLAVPAPYRTALCASPDGRYLVVLRAEGDATRADLFSVDLQGDRKPVPLVQTRFDDTEAQISPDGRWLAFVSNEAGRAEVYLQPFPAGGGRVQVSAAGGAQVRWAPSGKEIFYVAPDGRMTAVPVRLTAGAAPELGAPSALFSTSLATGTNVLGNKPQYVVARDGRFLLNATVGDAPTPPIVVVVNWQAGLSK